MTKNPLLEEIAEALMLAPQDRRVVTVYDADHKLTYVQFRDARTPHRAGDIDWTWEQLEATR